MAVFVKITLLNFSHQFQPQHDGVIDHSISE